MYWFHDRVCFVWKTERRFSEKFIFVVIDSKRNNRRDLEISTRSEDAMSVVFKPFRLLNSHYYHY